MLYHDARYVTQAGMLRPLKTIEFGEFSQSVNILLILFGAKFDLGSQIVHPSVRNNCDATEVTHTPN